MISEHEQWIAQAADFVRTRHYDEARQLALRIIREDGRNTKALWILAHSTDSLIERRNALNMLLRIEPNNVTARQLFDATIQQLRVQNDTSTKGSIDNRKSTNVIRSIR